jgi:hypothetical protein
MINHSNRSPRQRRANLRLILLTAFLSTALPGTAATIPPPEKLLPGDTLFLMTAPDCARMREVYRTSPQTLLWHDPAMKPFREKFMNRLKEELIQPLERELGVKFSDYTNLPQGQLTVAITPNSGQGGSDQPPALLLLLDARDKSSQLKTNLADLRKKWVGAGKSIKTEKIRDVEFMTVPLSAKDIPEALKKVLSPGQEDNESGEGGTNQAPKSELMIGQFESLLIVGNATRPVEIVVAHLTGGSVPSLGDLPAYQANRLALFRDAPLYGWVNAKSLIDLLIHKPSDPDAEGAGPFAMFNPERIVAATGLGGLKTLAFAFRNSSDGSFFEFAASAPEAGRQGLLKILPVNGRESGPPAFVPADVIKFQRSRIEGQKAWATLQTMLNDINPQLTASLNFVLDNANTAAREKDPDFDIRKRLFGNLGDDFVNYQKAPRGKTVADLSAAPSLLLLGSPQPEQLAGALKSLLGLVNQQGGAPTEREFLGRKIYSVQLPMMPLPGSDPRKSAPRTLNYAASSGYVALTMDVPMLEEYLRSSESQQKTLRNAAGIVDAAAKVGGTSSGWFGYENQAETARILVEALRGTAAAGTKETKAEASAGSMGFPVTQNAFKDWLDFSLLPPFEKISKYFHFTVYSAGANADGFAFKMFAPVPPQLKK